MKQMIISSFITYIVLIKKPAIKFLVPFNSGVTDKKKKFTFLVNFILDSFYQDLYISNSEHNKFGDVQC